MLDRAKFLVISEISEVSHEKTDAIEEKVDLALERCFTMKNRSIARAKAAKAAPTTRVSARAPPRRPRHWQRFGSIRHDKPAFSVGALRARRAAAYSLLVVHPDPTALRCAAPRRHISACDSASALERHHARGRRHRAPPARPRRGLRGQPHQQRRAADDLRRRSAPLFPRLRILYKAELRKLPILGPRVRSGRLRPARAGNREQSLPAIERAAAGAARGELVPDLSRRHAQPDRRAACPSRRGVHHGDQGAGADRAGRHHGRARRDAEGQPIIRPVTVTRPLRPADRNGRPDARRSRLGWSPGPR